MTLPVTIRPVRKDDLESLVALESIVWTRLGATPLAEDTLAAWYAERSPFFLVAECENVVCGFYFGRMVTMTEDRAQDFLDSRKMYATGVHSHPHDASGKSVYGITMLSVVPRAGKAIYEAVWRLKRKRKVLYSIGISRLPGLRDYMHHGTTAKVDEADIALWYALQSARLLRLRTLPHLQLVRVPFPYPALTVPDRMLAFHTYGTSFGLLGILPGFMTDPASLDYGAVIVSAYPHR